jgi:phosphotriesterase-related protein
MQAENQGRRGRVQTVLGLVTPSDLGMVLMHEHLFCDQFCDIWPLPAELSLRAKWEQPITLANRYDVLVNGGHYRHNMIVDSIEEAIEEMQLFRVAGGSTLVDVTPLPAGRDLGALREVARATNMHVVAGGGWLTHPFHSEHVRSASAEQLRDDLVVEVLSGVDGVRIGIIGEIGLSWPLHPDEEKMLRGALLAHLETGVAVTVHLGRHPDAPWDAIRIVEEAGVDPSAVILGHIDRTVSDRKELRRVAASGCYVELDLFGKEDSHGWPPPTWPNDATRLDHVRWLFEDGYGERVLISHDSGPRVRRARFGGPGIHHIPRRVVPLMRSKGFSDDEISQILVLNPAAVLTIR